MKVEGGARKLGLNDKCIPAQPALPPKVAESKEPRNLFPFLKNVQTKAEKFLEKIGIRQSPLPFWKMSKHEQNKKSFSKSLDWDITPPLKKFQTETDFFLGMASLMC